MKSSEVKELLENEIEGAEVSVVSQDHEEEDVEGRHFGLRIVSPEFEGKSKVQRHRMVYDALGDRMGNEIHAVEIEAVTPDEG